MAPSHVLVDVGVAAPGVEERFLVYAGVALGAVGGSRNEHRVPAFDGRQVNVGVEDRAVPHGDRDQVVDRDVVLWRRGLGEFDLPCRGRLCDKDNRK